MINLSNSIIVILFSFSYFFTSFINSTTPIPPEVENINYVQPWLCSNNDQGHILDGQEEQGKMFPYNTMNYALVNSAVKFNIPIVAHRFQNSCQITTTATEAEIIAEIDATNQTYEDLDFQINLVLIDIYEHVSDSANTGVPVICPTEGYEDPSYDQDFMDRYGIDGAINLFFVQGDTWQHANFPTATNGDTRNLVVIKFLNDGWSTLHELGHTFDLRHTFETGGDYVADTDSTLNLGFMEDAFLLTKTDANCITNDCNCSWEWTDPNQTLPLYDGVWNNIMNYGIRDCSRIFTQGQIDRMWEGFQKKLTFGDFDFCLLPPAQRNCQNILSLTGSVEG